jgi:hypothetical protein
LGTDLAVKSSGDDGELRTPGGVVSRQDSDYEELFMRKYISALLAGVVLSGLAIVNTGCTEESGVKTDTKITAPDGSSTRETREIKVDKKGDNAPLAPSEKK